MTGRSFTSKICHFGRAPGTGDLLTFELMPRFAQSSLVPGSVDRWLEVLRDESRTVTLASSTPTLTLRILPGEEPLWVRHELLSGFFRTTWTSRIERFDPEAGKIVAQVQGNIFQSFRHEMTWRSTNEGVLIHSDISWEGARPSLEQILGKAILRFPLAPGQVPSFSDSPTRRMLVAGSIKTA